jgi:type I restriction enzyme S subunit
MAPKTRSLDPSRYPDEEFELYSIPAYDSRQPQVAVGSSIGSAKQVVEAGDILLSRIVPHIRRSWVVANKRGRRIIASGEWIVFRCEEVHAGYLRHLLVSDSFHAEFMRTVAGVGGSLLRARPAQVAKIRVYLPPLAEQRRIAEVLDRAEELRVQRRAAVSQLDSLVRAIFLDLFGDPVANPRGWPLGKLGSVGTLDRGVSKRRPRNAPELLGGAHPLVQTGDVANCDGYIRAHSVTYSDLGLQQSRLWSAGTLCITIAANIAKSGILAFDACFPDSVVGFIAEDSATVEFVRAWLSFVQKALEESAPESAQKNINLSILRNLDIPLPPRSLQRVFSGRVAAVEKLKTSYRASLSELDALFASLQHRAFRGEL